MSAFPSLATSSKDQAYHESWAKAIATQSITDNWALKYRVKQEATKFFNQGSSGDMASFLQKAQDGTDLPAMWLSISPLKAKIENLIGELETRGWELRVRALSKEAVSRKLEEKEDLRVERRLQAVAKFAEEQTGLPLQDPNKQIPQTDRELEEYADLKYKDKLELIYEAGLKYIVANGNVDETRKATFRDVWVNNMPIIRHEVKRGKPLPVRVDPLCFIFDPDATDDMLSDSTYFGEVYYMGLTEAAEKYNLTSKQMEEAQGSYNAWLAGGFGMNGNTANTNSFFDTFPSSTLGWFQNINNTPRVLVVRTVWKDTKTTKYKDEINEKYKSEHLQELPEDSQAHKNVKTSKMECWRGCTLIGGTIVKDWGELPNQPRDIDSLESTLPPYTVWIPNYLLGQSVSKVEQVVALELLRDMAMYNLQLAMNRAGSKGFFYDAALMPEGWTFDKVAAHLKQAGIIAVNTKEYQMMQGGMNVLKEIDLSMTEGVKHYMGIMDFLDAQENMIIGTSAERQGNIQTPSQAVGVTDAAILRSTMTTQPYFKGFERFWSRVMSQQAKLMRICMTDREVWAPIIGDTGVDFLADNIDVDLESVGVVVEALPPLIQDRAAFEAFIQIAVQAQQLSPLDAMELMLEKDTKQALRKMQRKDILRKALEAAQAQAEQERDNQLQQQLAALQAQQQDKMIQSQMGLQQLKNKGNMDKTVVTGKVKLNEKKIDALMKD